MPTTGDFPNDLSLTEHVNATEEGSASGDNMTNGTVDSSQLPIDMQFNDGHLLSIIIYSVLMVFSAIGNLSVLTTIIKIRLKARLNRVNLLLLNLAIADLCVTFLMMPLEIGWNFTVSWQGGDVMCRLMSFFRTFGLYLSGFIISAISLDRYFAVLKPLALPEANRRGRIMLYAAWIAAFLCSLPQSYVFRLETHPVFKFYKNCVTFNSFSIPHSEMIYNFFGFFVMYGFPMTIIVYCYLCILYEIYKVNGLRKNNDGLRRSSMEALGRAKVRTLKMTVLIVATFFLCWTPYNVMSLWYWFDKTSAMKVDPRIQKGLFLFACTNSCVNPLIYGLFHIRNHQQKRDCPSNKPLNPAYPNRIERPPYGVRVRWSPRDCMCGGTSSGGGGDAINSASSSKCRVIVDRPCRRSNLDPDGQNVICTLIPLTSVSGDSQTRPHCSSANCKRPGNHKPSPGHLQQNGRQKGQTFRNTHGILKHGVSTPVGGPSSLPSLVTFQIQDHPL